MVVAVPSCWLCAVYAIISTDKIDSLQGRDALALVLFRIYSLVPEILGSEECYILQLANRIFNTLPKFTR
jgi:hypothetical protein